MCCAGHHSGAVITPGLMDCGEEFCKRDVSRRLPEEMFCEQTYRALPCQVLGTERRKGFLCFQERSLLPQVVQWEGTLSYALSNSLENSKEGSQPSLLGRDSERGHHWQASQVTAELSLGERRFLGQAGQGSLGGRSSVCVCPVVFGYMACFGNGWSFDVAPKVLRK